LERLDRFDEAIAEQLPESLGFITRLVGSFDDCVVWTSTRRVNQNASDFIGMFEGSKMPGVGQREHAAPWH
jgi:hypothetical protein